MLRKLLVTAVPVLGIFNNLFVLAADEPLLERGAYLTEGIVACGNCHTPKTSDAIPIKSMKFAGSFVIEEPVFKAYAPNITMDNETGIGNWTDDQIKTAITDGIRPDGRKLAPAMGFPYYKNIDEQDMDALVLYLRSLKPQPTDSN